MIIKLLRYINVFTLGIIITGMIWYFISNREVDLYLLAVSIFILSFIAEMIALYLLKLKLDKSEIHLFFNRNNEPLFANWLIIILSAIILILIMLYSPDSQGWFLLTIVATKGIEYLFKISRWNALIEDNNLHEKGFWMKTIPISEITNVHINNQAQLEITTPKGMTLFKLDSGISVNLRDKIEEFQTGSNE